MVWTILFIAFWVVVAVALALFALRAGRNESARSARQAEGRNGRRAGYVAFGLLVVGLGIALPAVLILGDRGKASAKVGDGGIHLTAQEKHGREVFAQNCSACHTLAAAKAVGKVGPNLDQVRPPKSLVVQVVTNGLTGQGTMPADLVNSTDTQAVAAFVAAVAGR